MFDQVQPVLQNFVATVLAGVLSLLAAFLVACAKKGFNWLSAKVDKINDDKAKDTLKLAISSLDTIVNTTVTSLQQSLGDDIKKSLQDGDGKYTREDLLALKDQALETINHQLTDSAKEALSSVYSDLNSYIGDLIDSKVRELKTGLSLKS